MKKRIFLTSIISGLIAGILYPIPDFFTKIIAGVVAFAILLALLFCIMPKDKIKEKS